MSARSCHDWSPLDCPSDPIPGDPDVVRETARQFMNTATSLGNASRNLRQLQFDGCSEFVTKFIEKSSKLAAQLDLVRVRYEAAGPALTNYVEALSSSQATSLSALNDAAHARAVYNRQHAIAASNYNHAKAATTPHEQQQWVEATKQAVTQRNAALADVNDAKRRLQAAIDQRDSAGDTAAGQIEQAVANSPLNDSVWDKFTEYIGKPIIDAVVTAGKWVWEHIDGIALTLTILSVALSWVPFAGPVLAALACVARGLALLKAGIDLGRALMEAGRKGDWVAFAQTLFVSGATLLIARYGGKGIAKLLTRFSGNLAGKAMVLGRQSLKAVNSIRNGMVRAVSNLKGGRFVAPKPFNPTWLKPGGGGAAFRRRIDRFVQGESIHSIAGHSATPPRNPVALNPLRSYFGPRVLVRDGSAVGFVFNLHPAVGLHHSDLHEGSKATFGYLLGKAEDFFIDGIGQQRTEVQACR